MVFAVVQAQALEDVTDVCHPFLSSIRMLAAICLDPQAGGDRQPRGPAYR